MLAWSISVLASPKGLGARSSAGMGGVRAGGYTWLVCGRYTLTDPAGLATRFGLLRPVPADETPRYNVAPSQPVLTVVVARAEGRSLRRMRWGFHPAWMDQPKRPPPINARAETLLKRPMFRDAVAGGWFLIPADGFHVWAGSGRARSVWGEEPQRRESRIAAPCLLR